MEHIERKAGALIAAFKELVFPEGEPAGAGPTPAKRARRDMADVDMKTLAAGKKVRGRVSGQTPVRGCRRVLNHIAGPRLADQTLRLKHGGMVTAGCEYHRGRRLVR